jgi:hypothetical protein
MACVASARGKQRAFNLGFAPTLSTAHNTQLIWSPAKRLMRRGGRLAHEKTRADGMNRTASRAKTIVKKASL